MPVFNLQNFRACTIIDFKTQFYERLLDQYSHNSFLFNRDKHATLIKTSPETEFLHFQILQQIIGKSHGKLEMDNLVLEVIEIVFSGGLDYKPNLKLHAKLKTNHLITIEKAKKFMIDNFENDISLLEITDHCNVSPFHFSRIFRAFTSYSPYQYLLNLRLKNAELLLRNTNLKVENIAFASGFNSLEHFTATFSKKFKAPPARFKTERHFSNPALTAPTYF